MTTIAHHIKKLTPNEQRLLYHKVIKLLGSESIESKTTATKQLVAFVKAGSDLDLAELKISLRKKLPEYMIPSKIIPVDEFPVLPNGKVDRRQLFRELDRSVPAELNRSEIPETPVQEKLKAVWEEVLHVSPIGIHDNFFDIGGDSISSIQIIAKARAAGIALEPKQLFEHQTISELSLFVKKYSPGERSQGRISGNVSLSPIQRWFFAEHKVAPHFWNHVVKVHCKSKVDFSIWKQLIEELVKHHDALRSSYHKSDKDWEMNILPSDEIKCVEYFDLSRASDPELLQDRIDKILVEHQANAPLREGNLFRLLYFELGPEREAIIYLIAHHLVVDMVSWNSIFDDLNTGLADLREGKVLNYKEKTDSLSDWSSYLSNLSQSEQLNNEIPFWEKQIARKDQLPSDKNDYQFPYTEENIAYITETLDTNTTSSLLGHANSAYNTNAEDLLITALYLSLRSWMNNNEVNISLERHGRAFDDPTIDVSNTIGWFTSFFPFVLHADEIEDIGNLIKSIKEQLRAIPREGIGYGILKYLSPDRSSSLADAKDSSFVFNYLGVMNTSEHEGLLNFEFEGLNQRDPRSERRYALDINIFAVADELKINLSYAEPRFESETILEFLNSFKLNIEKVLNYCLSKDSTRYSPSDFPEANLSQEDLDSLMDELF